MRKYTLVLLLLLTLLSVELIKVAAQENTVITLSTPQFWMAVYDDAYFQPFRDANPGVDVVLVTDNDSRMYPPSPITSSIEDHLNGVGNYTASADVLMVQEGTLSIESTRAGYWMDIAPLVAADRDLAEENFYPPAWRAFHWDSGMWALPATLQIALFTYDPAAFDKAHLSYPNEHWTIQDFASAAIALTERDAEGKITRAGCFCDERLIFYSLLGHGFAAPDDSPQLNTADLAALLETWGSINTQIYPSGNFSSEGVPMIMSGVENLVLSADEPMTAARLPGNTTKAYVSGWGISGGTANPAAAFQLVKYLAQNPRDSYGGNGQFPSLRAAEITGGQFGNPSNAFSPETQALIDYALENARSVADFNFSGYIYWAENAMNQQGLNAVTALDQAQARAVANLETASNWAGAQTVAVATPVPTAIFGTNEITVNFGISLTGLANQTEWQRVADEFAASDPEIGHINITLQGVDYDGFMANNDCYYLTYDATDPYRIADYINLDPLLDADPAFNKENFVPGALEALELDGKTWGYPLTMQPAILTFDPAAFQKYGVPVPNATWTLNEFADALNILQKADTGMAAFVPRQAENADYLLLIAAYGGLPIDFRTDPFTINFTDPNTVAAIQQVLDLAKSGAIAYSKLGTFNFSEPPGVGVIGATELQGYNAGFPGSAGMVNYPQGSAYHTMGLGEVGGMYISSKAQNIEACYRWMAAVAAHIELLPLMMPANLSAINSPTLAAAQGSTAVALYQELARLLSEPDTIIFHTGFGGGGIYSLELFFIDQWLDRAFDAYVLNDEELEPALAAAQEKVDAFLVCTSKLESSDATSSVDAINARYEGISECMKTVDPAMAAEQQGLAPSG